MKFFSSERSLDQPKATRLCIRSINQSNRSISVRFLFCCVRAFSFEGHTKIALTVGHYRRLAVQSFVWTERKYWTATCERSVFSARRNFVRSRVNVTWNSFICDNTLHKFHRRRWVRRVDFARHHQVCQDRRYDSVSFTVEPSYNEEPKGLVKLVCNTEVLLYRGSFIYFTINRSLYRGLRKRSKFETATNGIRAKIISQAMHDQNWYEKKNSLLDKGPVLALYWLRHL